MTVLKGLAEGDSKDEEFAIAFALVLAGSHVSPPVVRNIVSNARDGMYSPLKSYGLHGDVGGFSDDELRGRLPSIVVREYQELVPALIALMRDIYLKR